MQQFERKNPQNLGFGQRDIFSGRDIGKRWDVRLELFRQFKTDYVRRLEGVVFEKKSRLG